MRNARRSPTQTRIARHRMRRNSARVRPHQIHARMSAPAAESGKLVLLAIRLAEGRCSRRARAMRSWARFERKVLDPHAEVVRDQPPSRLACHDTASHRAAPNSSNQRISRTGLPTNSDEWHCHVSATDARCPGRRARQAAADLAAWLCLVWVHLEACRRAHPRQVRCDI